MKKYRFFILIIIFLVFIINTTNKNIIEYDNNQRIKVYNNKGNRIKDSYVGYIKINKINLKRGFYNKNSKNNKLNKNIKLLKESDDNLIILASHSGNSNVSFFKDLYRLNKGDEIELNYNKKELYIIDDIYDEVKDGDVVIRRDNTKKTLVLITCNQVNKKYQTIYISYRKE